MKNIIFAILVAIITIQYISAEDIKTIELGTKAPDFSLKGTDDKIYNLNSFAKAKILVVIFTCNHCPTAQAYEDRIIKFTADYKEKGVQVVAISPNSDKSVRLDELGYSDLNDSFEEMKIRAKDKKFNFPYLYDGNLQETTKKYGAIATPHVFIFDIDRKLQYVGRIDDNEHIGMQKTNEMSDAVDALLSNKKVETPKTKTFGCSIKWLSKSISKQEEAENWSKEPVNLLEANTDTLRKLIKNEGSGKYRLINIWATWCGPCVAEFKSLVETNLMYRNRDFEFISVSSDNVKNKAKTLSVLQQKHASIKNYIFNGNTKYDLIEAIDSSWQGAIPYTILISPQGQIVYKQMGEIDIIKLRKAIVDKLGRYFE